MVLRLNVFIENMTESWIKCSLCLVRSEELHLFEKTQVFSIVPSTAFSLVI